MGKKKPFNSKQIRKKLVIDCIGYGRILSYYLKLAVNSLHG